MLKIDVLYIIIGFTLGLLIIYLIIPNPKIIYKIPSINDIRNTTFKNESGQYYKYNIIEIPC